MTLMDYYLIVESWKLRKGKNELLKHLDSQSLTRAQAIVAKCYDCCQGYTDKAADCKTFHCPLYPYMPFREGGPKKIQKKNTSKKLSAEHIKKMQEARKQKRKN